MKKGPVMREFHKLINEGLQLKLYGTGSLVAEIKVTPVFSEQVI